MNLRIVVCEGPMLGTHGHGLLFKNKYWILASIMDSKQGQFCTYTGLAAASTTGRVPGRDSKSG